MNDTLFFVNHDLNLKETSFWLQIRAYTFKLNNDLYQILFF